MSVQTHHVSYILGPRVLCMLLRVSSPLRICILDDFIDLLQFRLGKHHITTCRILKGTLGVPGEYDQRCKRTNVATYDDPGSGMTPGN